MVEGNCVSEGGKVGAISVCGRAEGWECYLCAGGGRERKSGMVKGHKNMCFGERRRVIYKL